MDMTETKNLIALHAQNIRLSTASICEANEHDEPHVIIKCIPPLILNAHNIEKLAAQLHAEQSKHKEPLLCSQPPEKSSSPQSSSASPPESSSASPAAQPSPTGQPTKGH